MAGPTASILFREVVTRDQIQQLRAWLGPICDGNISTDVEWHPLYIRDCAALGLDPHDCDHPCAFGIGFGDLLSELEGTWKSVREQLGYIPAGTIDIWMGCNHDQDHRLLGRLALSIAERFGGVVDINGSIPITFPPERYWQAAPIASEEIADYLESIGGTIYTIRHDEGSTSHIVDTAFLRSWLQHRFFRMVK